jgi:adenine/guanine phosphoribosyltransferase-like PRPP-binding protein
LTPDHQFIRPTTHFWQTLVPLSAMGSDSEFSLTPPFRYGYPVRLEGDQVLMLPIRKVSGTENLAVASLIANQASFEVVRFLGKSMAKLAEAIAPEVIVGLPTLGMVFAPIVAEGLGHARYVPMGYSRKFWYRDELSVAVQSLTTPTQPKRVFLDPHQLPLIVGKRVLIVDDAVSTGGTLAAVMVLLHDLGANVQGAVVAMRQGQAWRDRLGPELSKRVQGVFDTPRLHWLGDGWWPE